MKIIKISIVTLILFFSFISSAQYISKKDKNNLIELSNNIISSSDDNKKINNEMFIEQIEQILYDEKSFYEMFDFINNSASIIMSEDKKIKIISWFLPLKEGHEFFCFIQEMIDKDYNFFFYKSGEITENYQKKSDLYKTKTINRENWIGSIYYDIKKYKTNNQDYYVLIGWSGNKLANYKIIEPMFFDQKKQEFQFGQPVFKINDEILHRYILSYYINSKLTLKFYDNQTIVFENLTKNNINSMPEGSYNALILKDEKWILKDNFTPKTKLKLKKRKKINNNLFPN